MEIDNNTQNEQNNGIESNESKSSTLNDISYMQENGYNVPDELKDKLNDEIQDLKDNGQEVPTELLDKQNELNGNDDSSKSIDELDAKIGVASNSNTSEQALNDLSKDDDIAVKIAVASNPNTSEETLDNLSKSENENVKMAVANKSSSVF